jgi:hypothetical protein
MSLLVWQTAGADERTGSARQQPRRSLCRQSIGRDVRSVLVFADITPARNSAGRGGCLGRKEARTGDGRHAAAGQGQGESLCLTEATCDTLRPPGRRIGQRGDATRAPTQGPRPGWAAGRRPSASRDWPQRDKSLNSSPRATSSPPPQAIRPCEVSSDLELIHPPPYAGSLLETEHLADLPLRRPIRPKSRRGWNSSFRTPT